MLLGAVAKVWRNDEKCNHDGKSDYVTGYQSCPEEEKEEKVLEREVLSVTARYFVIISKVSRSLLSVV
jgi:hypothetical protein